MRTLLFIDDSPTAAVCAVRLNRPVARRRAVGAWAGQPARQKRVAAAVEAFQDAAAVVVGAAAVVALLLLS